MSANIPKTIEEGSEAAPAARIAASELAVLAKKGLVYDLAQKRQKLIEELAQLDRQLGQLAEQIENAAGAPQEKPN